MNQEQIKMGMKISKKISKKNNKNNNKHGTLVEIQELLKKLGIPEGYRHYNDMFNILNASPNMFMKKINDWIVKYPEVYNNFDKESCLTTKFFNYCFKGIRKTNPNYYYDSKFHKIILNKPSEDSTEKINAVPINPTEKEISELKDQVEKLNKIKETADDVEDKKLKHEKSLKELSDKLEESQDEQREELNKKLKEKELNKKVEPETKPNIDPNEYDGMDEQIKQLLKEMEEKRRNPSNEDIIKTFDNYYHGSYESRNMKKDQFMDYLKSVVNDGRFINEKEEIKKKMYESTGEKKLIKEISDMFNDNKFQNKVNISDDKFEVFRDKLNRYMENNYPGFKIGDNVPNTSKLSNDLKTTIKSIDFTWNYITQDKLNDILAKYGFRIKSITPGTGNTIVFDDFNKPHEKELKDRKSGKIETDPVNSKEFFSYDIHEVYRIIEKGLKINLSTEAKNDIESIIRMETSNLINHLNISHGSSNIQNVIEQIEKYISSRMKNKSKSFKFSESNRYKLKELLKRFLNTRNNGQK